MNAEAKELIQNGEISSFGDIAESDWIQHV
jgi:hypothetical protein